MKKYIVLASATSNGIAHQFDTEEQAIANARQQSANSNGKPYFVLCRVGIAQNPVSAIQFTKDEV